MEHPSGLPPHLQPPLDAAIHAAEAEFLQKRKAGGAAFTGRWLRELIFCIKAIFFAFAKQACQAGREGLWTGEEIRTKIRDYLRQVASELYDEKYSLFCDPENVYERQSRADSIVAAIKSSRDYIGLQRTLAGIAEDRVKPQAPAPAQGGPIPRKSRTFREPRLELLKGRDFVNRKHAAEVLGITERTLDRYVSDGKLTRTAGKRFNSRELRDFLASKNTDKVDTK